jgi:hypothetical protein
MSTSDIRPKTGSNLLDTAERLHVSALGFGIRSPLSQIPGIGPKRAALLEERGLAIS